MTVSQTYRVTGVQNGQEFEVDAMMYEEAPFSIGLTYRLPSGERRAEWFKRIDNKRHGDNADVPFRMVLVEQS